MISFIQEVQVPVTTSKVKMLFTPFPNNTESKRDYFQVPQSQRHPYLSPKTVKTWISKAAKPMYRDPKIKKKKEQYLPM